MAVSLFRRKVRLSAGKGKFVNSILLRRMECCNHFLPRRSITSSSSNFCPFLRIKHARESRPIEERQAESIGGSRGFFHKKQNKTKNEWEYSISLFIYLKKMFLCPYCGNGLSCMSNYSQEELSKVSNGSRRREKKGQQRQIFRAGSA